MGGVRFAETLVTIDRTKVSWVSASQFAQFTLQFHGIKTFPDSVGSGINSMTSETNL